MIQLSYYTVIVACLGFIFAGCTVNLTDKRLDDLGERMTKVESALPQLVGVLNQHGQLLTQQQQELKKAEKPPEKK